MSSTQQVTGISSGFDTASIVEQLMKIEKIPYEKLDYKKQTEQLKLQAYQAVNSMLLKFRTSVGTLSSQKLWKSKSVASTNDKALTGTANEYAVNGTYAFRVAQLATATQYMTKGFASSKTAFVKQAQNEEPYKLGTISMNSAKTRVDTSAKLDMLNGGKGVYRGSVRVTDSNNNTSIIDLSACDTMDDVVRTLNESTGAQISASIKDGKLYVADEAGGGGALRIQNVGAGTTATDLGIAGSANTAEGALHGRNVYVIGNDTALSALQDGLGIEEGVFHLRVSDTSSYIDVAINVDECGTVGDVIERVNREIQARIDDNTVDQTGGGRAVDLLKNLRFGISGDKRGFSLTNTQQDHTYQFYNDGSNYQMAQQQPATDLGLAVGQKTASVDNEEIAFGRVIGDVNSPMLKNLSGVYDSGIGTAGSAATIDVGFSSQTLLRHLNGGKGLDISRPLMIQLREGGKDASGDGMVDIFENVLDQGKLKQLLAGTLPGYGTEPTVEDLVRFMNKSIEEYAADPDNKAAGLTGVRFLIDEYNNTLVVSGVQGGYQMEIAGTMAGQLGLTRHSSLGTAIDIDSANYADYADRKAAREEFYGINGGTYKPLTADNKEIGATGTLYDLVGLHGVTLTEGVDDSAAVNTALDTLFGGGNKMELSVYEYDSLGNVSRTRTVQVDLSGEGFHAGTSVDEFITKTNAAIQAAFDQDAALNSYDTISAPQLRVHTYGTGLQWSNMDFTKGFEASGTNAINAALGVDKSTVDPSTKELDEHFAPQAIDIINYQISAKASGYWKDMAVDGNTRMGDLRDGKHLTFDGPDEATLDIEVLNGKKISITMGELRNILTTANPSYALNTTIDQYVLGLNSLLTSKLADFNTLHGTAVDFNFQFNDTDDKIEITGLTGADRLIVSGHGANADRTGIGAISVDSITTDDPSKIYAVSTLSAKEFEEQAIQGLGTIRIDLGGTVEDLDTAGLDENSTLADLIDKLNGQIRDLAALYVESDPTTHKYKEFADIRFTINDAGTGIAVDNGSSKTLKFVDTKDANRLAQDLGLVDIKAGKGVEVESYSFHNSGSLGRKFIGRATKLTDYMGTAENGIIRLTNSAGGTTTLDLTNCKTVGDVIDFINGLQGFGIFAQVNERGDGFDIIEDWGNTPPPTEATGNISIADIDGGSIAKKLGIAGVGTRDDDVLGGRSLYRNSQNVVIDVMSSDTLESLMYRISEKGGYKTAIINDGSGNNPYRLTIASATTGEASDFVIESDLDMFGFNQTSRAKDSKVLYGDPNSGASPVMLSSSTNSNSNAILGLTLDLKNVTSDWTTLTIDTDKEKVTEEIKNMVQTYNDLNDLVSYLDAYDEESGEPGILFGDSNVRSLMEEVNDMFYLVFNPNQKTIGSVNDDGKQNTWTWMDMGVSLSAKNSNSDGTGSWYSSMDLDLDKLTEMVSKNWETLYEMLAGQRNASNSTLDETVKASAIFNGTAAKDFSVDNAINGDSNKGSWGINNGFMADGTIKEGQNEYTIYFQKATTISRMSIFHFDSDTALKNFEVEYLDSATGKWETLRSISNNSVDANHLGFATPTTCSGIRIKASSTNAEDDKFRLLDVQVFEDIGLAGKLNQLTTSLGDTTSGFLAERNNEITSTLNDIDEQMLRLQERLDLKEASLWRRFTAMETALGQLQSQSNYFSTMMDSMSTSKKK